MGYGQGADWSDEESLDSEDCQKYYQEVKASQGFDVSDCPKLARMVIPLPLPGPHNTNVLYYTKKAIDDENKKKDTKLEHESIVEAYFQPACPWNYLITFKAKGADGQSKTYQTKVCCGMKRGKYDIEIFRLKPTIEQASVTEEEACHCYKMQEIEDAGDVTEKADHGGKKVKIEE